MADARDFLVIGSLDSDLPPATDTLSWLSVPEGLPASFQYSVILVVPEPGTTSRQEQLLARLRRDLRLDIGSSDTRIVWVLNQHTVTDITNRLSLGTLEPIELVESGSIESTIRRTTSTSDIRFAVAEPPTQTFPIAVWRSQHRGAAIPVGVMSGDTRWLLVPCTSHLNDYLISYRKVFRRRWALPIALLLIFISTLAIGYAHYESQRRSYRLQVARLYSASLLAPARLPRIAGFSPEDWLSAEERLARRAVQEHLPALLRLSLRLSFDKPPHELFASHPASKSDPALAEQYLSLALMTGDTFSAQRVVLQTAPRRIEHRERLMRAVTGTWWQAAVEALHELDFPAALVFTELYLAASSHLSQEAEKEEDLEPHRNRTLAYILRRELLSKRARHLCNGPGVRDSFGRLLGRGWGKALPHAVNEALEERRNRNAKLFCDRVDPNADIDYSKLAELENLMWKPVTDTSDIRPAAVVSKDACKIAPLECDYLSLRLEMGEKASKAGRGKAISFAAQCSYLSDDMTSFVLRQLHSADPSDASTTHSIDFPTFARALACVERDRGDLSSLVATRVASARCNWFDRLPRGNKSLPTVISDAGVRLVERCRS